MACVWSARVRLLPFVLQKAGACQVLCHSKRVLSRAVSVSFCVISTGLEIYQGLRQSGAVSLELR